MKKKILLFGYYGKSNLGDELILKSLIDKFDKKGEISIASFNPKLTKKIYEKETLSILNPLKVVQKIISSNVVIVGGGGLIQDINSYFGIFLFLYPLFVGSLFKKRTILCGVSVDSVRFKLNKLIIKLILNRVDYITVRDSISKEKLNSYGIIKKIEVKPDLSFHVLNKIRFDKKIDKKKVTIGVSIRSWENNKTTTIVNFLEYLVQNYDARIIFIISQKDYDYKITREIMTRLSSISKNIHMFEDIYNEEGLINFYKKIDFFIGMRLHTIILAVVSLTPFLAISYTDKVKSFCKELSLQKYCIEINNLDESILIKNFEYILNNKDKVIKEMSNKLREINKRLDYEIDLNR